MRKQAALELGELPSQDLAVIMQLQVQHALQLGIDMRRRDALKYEVNNISTKVNKIEGLLRVSRTKERSKDTR